MNTAKAQLHLVHGGSYTQRETAIAASLSRLPATLSNAVILEGLPAGQDILLATNNLHVTRIAPGCFCCIGNLSLRVTLNRVLRQKPAHIFLGVASDAHLDQLSLTLQEPGYANWLEIASQPRL
ncbi:GTPase [Undibacterium sp. Di26W]|uniref:GTPase n=1 Tax=Undibacterium sp. Di26W TaxID=3413035 RepID=UPI003BF032B2